MKAEILLWGLPSLLFFFFTFLPNFFFRIFCPCPRISIPWSCPDVREARIGIAFCKREREEKQTKSKRQQTGDHTPEASLPSWQGRRNRGSAHVEACIYFVLSFLDSAFGREQRFLFCFFLGFFFRVFFVSTRIRKYENTTAPRPQARGERRRGRVGAARSGRTDDAGWRRAHGVAAVNSQLGVAAKSRG